MSAEFSCLVCDTRSPTPVEACPACRWPFHTQEFLVFLSPAERSVYDARLTEARERWAVLGRYDQSPRRAQRVGEPRYGPSSNSMVAMGGGLV